MKKKTDKYIAGSDQVTFKSGARHKLGLVFYGKPTVLQRMSCWILGIPIITKTGISSKDIPKDIYDKVDDNFMDLL